MCSPAPPHGLLNKYGKLPMLGRVGNGGSEMSQGHESTSLALLIHMKS